MCKEGEETEGEAREEDEGEGEERRRRRRFGPEIGSEQGIRRTLEEDEGREGSHKKVGHQRMAAIFGVRAYAYSSAHPPLPPLRVNTKRRNTLLDRGDSGGAADKRNKMRRYKKRDDDDGSSGNTAKKKKKRKRASEY